MCIFWLIFSYEEFQSLGDIKIFQNHFVSQNLHLIYRIQMYFHIIHVFTYFNSGFSTVMLRNIPVFPPSGNVFDVLKIKPK